MPTGDLKNNLRKLQTEVKLMKYPDTLDIPNLTIGDAKAFMPIYHYAFTSFSPSFAEEIAAKEVLFAKSDSGFMDSVYRILRDMFSYRPLVTKDQFFSSQFAERKIIMCTEVLQHIQRKCRVQPASKSNFRLNSSMDNIAKPPSGKSRPRSALNENKENKDSRNTEMPPPLSGPKKTNLNRSTSSVPRMESNKYRLPTARSSIPKQTRPHNVKDVLGAKSDVPTSKPAVVKEVLNHSVDSALAFSFTPSIARVKPQSVEVINMPRTQAGGSNSSMLGRTEAGPGGGVAPCVDQQGEKLERLIALMENVQARLTLLEEKQPLLEARPEPKPTTPKRHVEESGHIANLEARLTLLENRILLLESKTPEPEKISPVCNKSGKVTPGKQGTFMVVESFVNGESKVRKMAREAEAKIRSRSFDEDMEKPSPIRKSPAKESKTMDEEMFTMIPDPEPCHSSTPTKPNTEDISLKCVDTPTQDQANRIQHLVESTKSLLKPAQTELTADEEKRQDVD